ncbi:MAG TPA: HEAT repeat domain-containing protein [Bryobacteraceae bacterium]
MRWFAILTLSAALCAQEPPRIGIIDFYGLHKVPEAKIREALGAREGGFLPRSKGDAEDNINKVAGVIDSHLEAVCCDAGKAILYVGIEERGAVRFEIRDAPEEGDGSGPKIPSDIFSTYRRFQETRSDAIRRAASSEKAIAEDLTQGYSRMADLNARAVQDMFPALVKDHLADLRAVLHQSPDDDQRAIAAYVIGYAPQKIRIVDDLQYALRDSDPDVRANACRSLVAIAVFARLNPGEGIKIEPTWFIEMLNSLSWSDRNRALAALQIFTDMRDPAVLDQLRERALEPLIEMARWKTLAHALPAFILVGRVAGLTDEQIQDAWSRGDREKIIAAAKKK